MNRAVRVWYFRTAGAALGDTLVWTLAPVYFVQTVGMSPLQLILVGTFMEITIFICEVPTGIIADVVSRRLSIIIGYLVMGAAIVFSALIAEPWAVIVSWSVWGLGYTFTSGAEDAWLADEIGVDHVQPVYLRSAQVGRLMSLVAIAGSVALGLVSLRLPVLVGGVVIAVVGVVLALVMPETGFRPAPREKHDGAIRTFATTGHAAARHVRRTPVLLLILAIAASWGASSEAYDRLSEAHLILDVGMPDFGGLSYIVWFGVIAAASLVLSLLIARPVNRRLEAAPRRDRHARSPVREYRADRHGDDVRPRRGILAGAPGDAGDEHDPLARLPALLELAELVDHGLDRAGDGDLVREPGGRAWPVDGRAGDRCHRQRLRHPSGPGRGRRAACSSRGALRAGRAATGANPGRDRARFAEPVRCYRPLAIESSRMPSRGIMSASTVTVTMRNPAST